MRMEWKRLVIGICFLLPGFATANNERFFVLCQVAVVEGGRLGYKGAGEALGRITTELRSISNLKSDHQTTLAKLEALSGEIGIREKYLYGRFGGDRDRSEDYRRANRLERDLRAAIARREKELGDYEIEAAQLLDELIGGILRAEWIDLDEIYRQSLTDLFKQSQSVLALVNRLSDARKVLVEALDVRRDPIHLLEAQAAVRQIESELFRTLGGVQASWLRLTEQLSKNPGTPQLVSLYLQQNWEWILPKLDNTAALLKILRQRLTALTRLLDNPYL
ncbi:MAG: hypothetical protein KDD39_08620 [Bdellovibrionales bacterium]|nr:hypothetical protein [Bdellovibrionales bacterium]